ncbi:hypothetical protein [Chromobacterium sphagni]|uniref:Uncharacterized protein n=1 Tax=Chromobacterium sphagni TaxID=1903179 RepID=A0ABX3CEY1_9NEIS|nr:hypothetical protein [Chromobacterium sphagni]OHX20885.1 hypothetical protein BI344_22525 [Chromobacterium sphagni]
MALAMRHQDAPITLRDITNITQNDQYLLKMTNARYQSDAAVATVVGVLTEMRVMLLVRYIIKANKSWHENSA